MSSKRRIGYGYKPTLYPRAPRPITKAQAAVASRVAVARIYPRAPMVGVAGEMKYFDCSSSQVALAACTTTWVAGTMVDPLTTINLGDVAIANPLGLFSPIVSANLNGRIGRKVKVFKIKINGFVNIPVQAAIGNLDAPARVRLILVQDQQTNSAQMTGAQLMEDSTNGDTTVCGFQNPNNFGRFRVLKEKWFSFFNPNTQLIGANVDQQGLLQAFKFSIIFKQPILVNFNATAGGTITSVIDNSFHLVCGTNIIQLAPNIAYSSRVCYKE